MHIFWHTLSSFWYGLLPWLAMSIITFSNSILHLIHLSVQKICSVLSVAWKIWIGCNKKRRKRRHFRKQPPISFDGRKKGWNWLILFISKKLLRYIWYFHILYHQQRYCDNIPNMQCIAQPCLLHRSKIDFCIYLPLPSHFKPAQ